MRGHAYSTYPHDASEDVVLSQSLAAPGPAPISFLLDMRPE